MPTDNQKPISILAEAVELIREMEFYTNEWDWPIDLGDRIEAFAKRAEAELETKPLAEFTVDGNVIENSLGARYRYLDAGAYGILGPAAELAEAAALSSVPPGPVRVRIVVERREVDQ